MASLTLSPDKSADTYLSSFRTKLYDNLKPKNLSDYVTGETSPRAASTLVIACIIQATHEVITTHFAEVQHETQYILARHGNWQTVEGFVRAVEKVLRDWQKLERIHVWNPSLIAGPGMTKEDSDEVKKLHSTRTQIQAVGRSHSFSARSTSNVNLPPAWLIGTPGAGSGAGSGRAKDGGTGSGTGTPVGTGTVSSNSGGAGNTYSGVATGSGIGMGNPHGLSRLATLSMVAQPVTPSPAGGSRLAATATADLARLISPSPTQSPISGPNNIYTPAPSPSPVPSDCSAVSSVMEMPLFNAANGAKGKAPEA